MNLPALSGCPGKPACDGDVALCEDHKDVARAILAERERCAKVCEDSVVAHAGILECTMTPYELAHKIRYGSVS